MTEDNFYRDFENKNRGSRELIKERLKVYLPFVSPLHVIYPDCVAFDIGCGRGEWLELMSEIGFEAYGCDIDEGMLRACYERGLSATKQEAVSFLKSLPDESHVVISAFHVIEHISFDDLRTLVSESLRVLKPGGLLILETPNIENINVATNNFYLDSTHKRPIPPLMLSYLPEYYGFKRVKLLRLQESLELATKDKIKLIDILKGVSPDIAVVAQKDASVEIMSLFNQAFNENYGITLDDLAERYDVFIENKIDFISKELQSVYQSKSWKITNPLRRLAKFIRWFKNGSIAWLTFAPQSRPRRIARKLLIKAKDYVLKKPKLKAKIKLALKPFPSLLIRLKRIGYSNIDNTEVKSKELQSVYQSKDELSKEEVSDLSPRVQKIYLDLKNAVEEGKNKCV
ncbi:MAG: class I SAM-dependent methyltransferase [Candidatus Acidulodesulfobacterium acidiphilum]|uniref:Class I SAM-dependent methyltransferase n=1 Tax=Candidatus Acidulodesulfobacterium acidiphilum TaxID=2597224 RepID=A0A520XC06_9DELT|nr:MAG: class I SAM-dependent methyltransferase [Candidatus Acidulodesulfobacterium acidiphilum]